MKRPFCISSLLFCIIWLTACTGPVIIEEPEKKPTNTEQSENTEQNDSTPEEIPDSVSIIHEGTYTSPYSIAEVLTLKRGVSMWIEGYIVGCVSGSMKSGCNYSQEATTTSNILLADIFPAGNENDYQKCLPVELPNNSMEREELNLYDNPDNFHRKVRILGDITLYYKVTGMKKIEDFIFCDEVKNDNNDEDEDGKDNEDENDNKNQNDNEKPYDPDATRQDTLSIAEGIKLQHKGDQPYIRGYIVGYYNGYSPVFNPTPEQMLSSRASNNVILADNIDENSENNVIIVELPKETALQRTVNLNENPQNLHRRLTVKGMLREYNEDTGYHGCMKTESAYKDDEDYYFLLE